MSVSGAETVAERVRLVQDSIRRAEVRAGRPPGAVRLVAVTKSVPVERMQEGIDAGLSLLGENRLQEAQAKMSALSQAPVRWHFIGHLQRRKVRSMLNRFDLIHSVDSVELAQEIDRRAGDAGLCQDILLEVNIGEESTKSGFQPDALAGLMPAMALLSHVRIRGLMASPPPTAEAEQARPHFRRLHDLACQIGDLQLPSVAMADLSMGMSNDYEVAIEEGATLVRVGTALFGIRPG
jgi:pyridoxal phosphate enzyme (YggS family)